jgi:hypothetical protein
MLQALLPAGKPTTHKQQQGEMSGFGSSHSRRAAHYKSQIRNNFIDRLVCTDLKLANAF